MRRGVVLQVRDARRPGGGARQPKDAEDAGEDQVEDRPHGVRLVQGRVENVEHKGAARVQHAQHAGGDEEARRRAKVHRQLLRAVAARPTIAAVQVLELGVAEVERILHRVLGDALN